MLQKYHGGLTDLHNFFKPLQIRAKYDRIRKSKLNVSRNGVNSNAFCNVPILSIGNNVFRELTFMKLYVVADSRC